MDGIEISQRNGDRTDPARVRVTHENRVLDTSTVLSLSVIPREANRLAYPTVHIEESPPVRCFLYDWLQYINFKLQREAQNILTAKEQQLKTLAAFDIFPRSQAEYVEVIVASWQPTYSAEPAQTGELYELLDKLLQLPPVEFEDQELVSAFRVTGDGRQRVTGNGDRRIAIVEDPIATILPVAA